MTQNSIEYDPYPEHGIEITKKEILKILSNPNSDLQELAPFKELIEDSLRCQIQK